MFIVFLSILLSICSQCVPLEGKRFTRGGYKCECRQGYEYPFNDLAWFFDGQTMEEEWRKLSAGEPNRWADNSVLYTVSVGNVRQFLDVCPGEDLQHL